MVLLCRHFSPALVLSLLDPKLSWDEAEVQASIEQGVEVVKADGTPLSPYDLKRLQVCCCTCKCTCFDSWNTRSYGDFYDSIMCQLSTNMLFCGSAKVAQSLYLCAISSILPHCGKSMQQ